MNYKYQRKLQEIAYSKSLKGNDRTGIKYAKVLYYFDSRFIKL